MNRRPSSPLRLALSAAACVAALALRAADRGKDNAPAAPAPARAEDSLAAARTEFEAIKAQRDAALQPKGEVPRIAQPAWQDPSNASVPAALRRTPPGKETRSATWLLDAMEKSADADGKSRDKRERERPAGGGRDGGDGWGEKASFGREPDVGAERNPAARSPVARSRATEKADGDETRTRVKSAAANPLAKFLGDWISPQDYALLKAGAGSPSGVGADGPARGRWSGADLALPVSSVPPGASGEGGLNGVFGFNTAAPTTHASPPAPRENPYLQSLAASGSAVTAAVPQAKIAGPAPAPGAVATPPIFSPQVSPPPPSPAPDFAKPPADEKYFKQLKRF